MCWGKRKRSQMPLYLGGHPGIFSGVPTKSSTGEDVCQTYYCGASMNLGLSQPSLRFGGACLSSFLDHRAVLTVKSTDQ